MNLLTTAAKELLDAYEEYDVYPDVSCERIGRARDALKAAVRAGIEAERSPSLNFSPKDWAEEMDVLISSANNNPPWNQPDHKGIAPCRHDASMARTLEGMKQDYLSLTSLASTSTPHWIPVKDRLPPNQITVLFSGPHYRCLGYCEYSPHQPPEWHDLSDIGGVIPPPTHWMPIPPQPNDTGEQECITINKI